LMSMSYGLPVIASKIAAEGIPVVNGQNIVVVEEEKDWIEAVSKLYMDEELWDELSVGGLQLIHDHYSKSIVKEKVAQLIKDI